MSEIEELRKEVAALRTELEHWQTIVVCQEGKTGRALGLAEGAAEMQGLLNRSFEARIAALEQSKSRSAISISPFTASTVAET